MIDGVHGIDRHKRFPTISVPNRQGEDVHFEGGWPECEEQVEGLRPTDAVVLQVNEPTSVARDAYGRVLARQDFFGTEDRVMLADVMTRRVGTLYGVTAGWLA